MNAFYYPDLFVTCHPAYGQENIFKRRPVLVVEVLSNSTAAFDQGTKFAHYRRLDSLLEYVLIEPGRPSIDVFRRTVGGSWVLYPVTEGGELVLTAIGFHYPLAAVYEGVALGR